MQMQSTWSENKDNGTKKSQFNNSQSYRHNGFLNVHNTTPSLTCSNIIKSARTESPLATNSNGKIKLKKVHKLCNEYGNNVNVDHRDNVRSGTCH